MKKQSNVAYIGKQAYNVILFETVSTNHSYTESAMNDICQ